MDAVLLCGGRGTRFAADVEKPLFPVVGEPMVDRVLAALRTSGVGTVHAAVSPAAPETREHLRGTVPTVETPGEGYVPDLTAALASVGRPALTVAADLPLLAPDVVDGLLAAHGDGSLTTCVPAALKRTLGVTADARLPGDRSLSPAGLNVVGDGPDRRRVVWDVRLAVNVNRRADAAVAERLCDDVSVGE
jgi:adenosylcobinamide-phosphate guanylyltransferase